jgi:hypothetical protein
MNRPDQTKIRGWETVSLLLHIIIIIIIIIIITSIVSNSKYARALLRVSLEKIILLFPLGLSKKIVTLENFCCLKELSDFGYFDAKKMFSKLSTDTLQTIFSKIWIVSVMSDSSFI